MDRERTELKEIKDKGPNLKNKNKRIKSLFHSHFYMIVNILL